MQDTIVIDGELSLIIADDAEHSLIIPESGEVGVYMSAGGNALPTYTGETTVIPKAFMQTILETANKSVYSDITVEEIPYEEVSNISGGYTVSIG